MKNQSFIQLAIILSLILLSSTCQVTSTSKPMGVCYDTVGKVEDTMLLCPSSRWTGSGNFTYYHRILAHKKYKQLKKMSALISQPDQNGYRIQYHYKKGGYKFSGPREISDPVKCFKSCSITISYQAQYGFILTFSQFPITTQTAPDVFRFQIEQNGTFQFIYNQVQWKEIGFYNIFSPTSNTADSEDSPFVNLMDLKLSSQLPNVIIDYYPIVTTKYES